MEKYFVGSVKYILSVIIFTFVQVMAGWGLPVRQQSSLQVLPSCITLGRRWKVNIGADSFSSLYSCEQKIFYIITSKNI